jgi:squalene cyclase
MSKLERVAKLHRTEQSRGSTSGPPERSVSGVVARSDDPVRRAVERGAAALLAAQRPDGSFMSDPDMGPLAVAITALCEAWFDVLTPSDARRYATALRAAQLPDGGFAVRPLAATGTLGATAVCRAALKVCGVADGAPAARRADQRIATLGGYARLHERLLSHGEPGLVFAVMAGLAPAHQLPPISPDMAALPWSERMLDGRLHAGVPVVLYAIAAVRERFTHKSSLVPAFLRGPTRLLARTRLAGYLGQFQNRSGSWNGMVFSTVFSLIALEGVGMTKDDPMVQRGLAWIESRKRRTDDGMRVVPFDGEHWETAFSISALLVSGLDVQDPALVRAAQFLVAGQATEPQPRANQPQPNAPRSGGWAFMRGNEPMADCDDTGVVLAALGAARRKRRGPLDPTLQRGVDWMRAMQNPSGGFAVYVHGLPDKRMGDPLFVQPLPRLDDVRGLLEGLVSPPPELGDPATSDLTGRALWGLGACGLTVKDPTVAKAVAFVERDQRADGSWWGMWNPAYVASTAFVLLGLGSVRADLGAPFVQRAVAWLASVQNADGGFGESVEAFAAPSLAGRGPSNAPLTGVVLRALAECRADKALDAAGVAAGERAAAYLAETQTPEGDWPNGDYVFTIIPPTFYVWELHRLYYVLFGLGRWVEATATRGARSA